MPPEQQHTVASIRIPYADRVVARTAEESTVRRCVVILETFDPAGVPLEHADAAEARSNIRSGSMTPTICRLPLQFPHTRRAIVAAGEDGAIARAVR
jgi:hypothetical protein